MITNVHTLGELIDRAAEKWPNNEAIVWQGRRIHYGEFCNRVNRLASALLRLGVSKGDKVSVLLTNRPEWALTEFAIDKIGAIVVPINPRYSPKELEHILQHSDSTTLVMMDRSQDLDYVRMLKTLCPGLGTSSPGDLYCEHLPFLKNIIVQGERTYLGTFDLDNLVDGGPGVDLALLQKVQSQVMGDDIAHLPYTSGTTGKPKGVMTTHQQYIRFNLGFIKGIGGFKEQDRLLVAPPFSHNFGNSQGILTPAFCGAASILIEHFSPKQCLRLIQEEKCTFFAGSPTMYIRMLRHEDFQKFDLSSLRSGLIAAAPASVSLIKEIKDRMGIEILVNGFGMTENSVGTSMTRPEDPPEILAETVGRPLWPDYEVKIVDTRTGEDIPHGSEGELCTRGPLVMKGYYKEEQKSAELIDQMGWFHTGDLATIDSSGNIRITGRLKDIYMPGGLNVAPEEVEEVIFTHPKVKQVCVVGVPDADLGETGAAFVELKPAQIATAQELIAFCEGRLSKFKIPKHILFTSEFPMTTSGKVQRFILRERAVKDLKLQ
jgi:fatty-acyl-CoA synthase